MWHAIALLILRNRLLILISLVVVTAFMAYHAKDVKERYKFGGILPEDDSTYVEYQKFLDKFSQDGNVVVFGAQGEEIFDVEHFAAWYELGEDIKSVDGVDSVFSIAHLFTLQKIEEEVRFELVPLVHDSPTSQSEVDSIRSQLESLPFYDGLLYNDSTNATLMMAFVNAERFNSENRGTVVDEVMDLAKTFSIEHMNLAYSGLPHIRTSTAKQVKAEMSRFVALAALITALILFFFFRSIRVVIFCLLVVGVGVIWSVGTIELLNYRLSSLSALIPPLIIVIGIPNCVFLLNKYHQEFRNHGNKLKALTRVIEKIGNATFLTNVTTALGFATFIFTQSDLLQEFGVIASLNILGIFLLALFIIPIVFSFLPDPKPRHTKHLEKQWLDKVVSKLVQWVTRRRLAVYLTTAVTLCICIYGVSIMKTTGTIADDLPDDNGIITDLNWFEQHFSGVMPFEVLVDTGRKGQAVKPKNLKKVERLQKLLAEYPQFSRSLSLVDAVKFARQSYYNGVVSRYGLPTSTDRALISPYLSAKGSGFGTTDLFLDSTKQISRVSAQMADIGIVEMEKVFQELKPRVDSIFNPDKYTVTMTGTSVVFAKGTRYLVKNLMLTLALAVVVIGIIMYILFGSMRMVFISLIPNLIPLICTAAMMGLAGIPLKPSTILVFSIVFGISVDDTIHFLAKYRQELSAHPNDVRSAAINAVKETGVSMIYTSIVLFFGFGIFVSSRFGGSQAIGLLSSFTLLVAMLANLVLLPSLILSLQKLMTMRMLKEPLLEILDEEEDIDLESLRIRKDKE